MFFLGIVRDHEISDDMVCPCTYLMKTWRRHTNWTHADYYTLNTLFYSCWLRDGSRSNYNHIDTKWHPFGNQCVKTLGTYRRSYHDLSSHQGQSLDLLTTQSVPLWRCCPTDFQFFFVLRSRRSVFSYPEVSDSSRIRQGVWLRKTSIYTIVVLMSGLQKNIFMQSESSTIILQLFFQYKGTDVHDSFAISSQTGNRGNKQFTYQTVTATLNTATTEYQLYSS